MKKLIVTNTVRFAGLSLPNDVAGTFLIAAKGAAAGDMREFLIGRGMKEMGLRELSLRYAEEVKDGFSKGIFAVNRSNGSPEWWAMSFTNKNPLISPLFEEAFYAYVTMQAVKTMDEGVFVLVSDDTSLFEQLKASYARCDVIVCGYIDKFSRIRRFFTEHMAASIVSIFLKIAVAKMLAGIFLKKPGAYDSPDTVVASQFMDWAIGPNGLYRDVYMTGLQDLLGGRGQRVLTAGFVSCNILRFILRLSKNDANKRIYPIDYFISWGDLFRAAAYTVKRYVRLPPTPKFIVKDADMSVLLRNEIRSSVNSGQLLLHTAIRYASGSLARMYPFKRVIVPFENRSWEKMIIIGFREVSPGTTFIGYQHAAVTLNHINFLFEQGECDGMPFPDTIVTMGPAVSEMLKSRFNLPPERIRSGSALRQRLPDGGLPRPGQKAINILAVLGTGPDEYAYIMDFLKTVSEKSPDLSIVVRPHPALSMEEMLRRNGIHIAYKFKVDTSSIEDSFRKADVVVYYSSTVSIEALARGIPVICIDVPGILSSDPLFTGAPLRWRCCEPEEFMNILKKIRELGAAELEGLREEARAFTRSYFAPVTKDSVGVFL